MLPNPSDSRRTEWTTHKNARLTPKGREEMVRAVVDDGLTRALDHQLPRCTLLRLSGPFERPCVGLEFNGSFHPFGASGALGLASSPAVPAISQAQITGPKFPLERPSCAAAISS